MKRILAHGLVCCVLLLALLDTSLAAPATPAKPVAAPASAVTAPPPSQLQAHAFPVVFANVDIFEVSNSPIGSLSPQARAGLIQQNIQAFSDSKADVNGLKVTSHPEGLAIGSDSSTLMVVTPGDAEASAKPAADLANDILHKIQHAVELYRTKHAWKTYGLGATYSALSILLLWQALYWNNRLFSLLSKRAIALSLIWKRGLHFKEFEVLSTARIVRLTLLGLRFLRLLVILLCLYFFLPLILSFFPETQALSSRILDYLISPFASIFHTVLKYIPNFFYIFVIGVIAHFFLKMFSYVFSLIEHGDITLEWFYDDWARPTYQIVRFLVIVTALISAYPYIPGSSSQAFQGVGLVLGAIISFASSSAISNIVAGVILTYTRAFRLNDRVKIGESVGDVVEKTLLVTRINTIKQVTITIPNSLVMGAQIINYSTSAAEGEGVILHTTVTIGFDVPWQQVEQLLVDAALATGHVLQQPKPFVLQTSLDDFYVSHEINAYTREPEHMATIYAELHRNILDQFDAAGVEIMSPHYYALRDGNASTVPSVFDSKGYEQPAFKVSGRQ